MKPRLLFVVLTCAFCCATVFAQQPDQKALLEAIEKDGCVTIASARICKSDYPFEGTNLEALTFRPEADGKYPGVLLVPGYQGRAGDYIHLGRILAAEGIASVAVTQPGWGKSTGKADYVGPKTIEALTLGFNKLKQEKFVDSEKMGIFGYSRGGMAASLLAVKLKGLKAVVLGAGVYDFKRAYDEIKIEGITANMKRESGMTEEAIKERSSVLQMDRLQAPVLILHGEKDENVPVSQALLLRDRLKELKKDFEIKLFPNAAHGIPRSEFLPLLIDFFNRRLKGTK